MPWIQTQSSTLPSPCVAASTGTDPAPAGAVEVSLPIAVMVVGNPTAYVLQSKESVSRAAPTLADLQNTQRARIRSAFTAASSASVTDKNGVTWDGGESSGMKLFLAIQLSQQGGETTVTLYDVNRTPHVLTVAQGMTVAALIGAEYQKAFAQKQALYADIQQATTAQEVEAVAWK